jgi:hypothetical protein
MSIDSSIPLGIKSLGGEGMNAASGMESGIKMASMIQQIQASKANQANTEAQLPGIQADSEVKQRALRFNDWTSKNAASFRNADGSVNTLKAVEAAKDAGFGNEAQAFAANDLQGEANRIKNATDQQSQQHAQSNFMIKGIAHTASLIDGMPEDEAGALLKKSAALQDQLVPGSGQQMLGMLTRTEEVKGPDGKPVMGPDGNPVMKQTIDKNAIKGAKTASMSALEQNDLALRTSRQNADFENSMQTPEGHATSGPIVNAAYAALRSAGYGEDKVPTGLSAYQLKQMGYGDIIKEAVTANKIPAASRQQQFNEGLIAQNDVKQIDLALQAVGKADNKSLATRPGSLATDAFDKWVAQNPAYAGLKTAIVTHNSKYPTDIIDPAAMSLGQIKAKLEQTKLRRAQDADTWLGASGMTQLPGNPAQGGIPDQQLPPGTQPTAPQGQAPAMPARPQAPAQAAPQSAPQASGKAWTSKHLEELAKKSGMTVPALRALAAQKGIVIKD